VDVADWKHAPVFVSQQLTEPAGAVGHWPWHWLSAVHVVGQTGVGHSATVDSKHAPVATSQQLTEPAVAAGHWL
jgi:hypothetical protein